MRDLEKAVEDELGILTKQASADNRNNVNRNILYK
jgi:hypothetical protein